MPPPPDPMLPTLPLPPPSNPSILARSQWPPKKLSRSCRPRSFHGQRKLREWGLDRLADIPFPFVTAPAPPQPNELPPRPRPQTEQLPPKKRKRKTAALQMLARDFDDDDATLRSVSEAVQEAKEESTEDRHPLVDQAEAGQGAADVEPVAAQNQETAGTARKE